MTSRTFRPYDPDDLWLLPPSPRAWMPAISARRTSRPSRRWAVPRSSRRIASSMDGPCPPRHAVALRRACRWRTACGAPSGPNPVGVCMLGARPSWSRSLGRSSKGEASASFCCAGCARSGGNGRSSVPRTMSSSSGPPSGIDDDVRGRGCGRWGAARRRCGEPRDRGLRQDSPARTSPNSRSTARIMAQVPQCRTGS